MTYAPPTEDMRFLLTDVLGFEHPDLDAETISAVLDEAAKLGRDVLAPLNVTGDKHGCVLKDGAVTTPPGFRDAYEQYCAGGWNAVPFDPEHGGQGLPWALAFPIQEMWQGANMAFGLCPLLNQGAVEALQHHGSEDLKQKYLPKLISGEWAGTMNLTEPQAGSDLSTIRTRAERRDDGHFNIFGQKIYITYGEHDFTENIIHLVLARIDDAPEGTKGLSLFLAPKFLEDGARNDVYCTGIEHKLGIHASPTCTMQYGDNGGALGYLVGKENEGLKCMFTMMNNARLSVGLQGVAIAEAAYQKALSYAHERVQGKSFETGKPAPIAEHGDVRRMLSDMRAKVTAGRLMTYYAAINLDKALAGDKEAQAVADLFTPLVKSWCTDMAIDVASTGIQVHGGMGYIEETGAAQFLRDARILPIYEGTNGIQALDFMFRKILRDEGKTALGWLGAQEARSSHTKALKERMMDLTDKVTGSAPERASGAATPYLSAFALTAAGLLLEKPDEIKNKKFGEDAAHFTGSIMPYALAEIERAVYLLSAAAPEPPTAL